MTDIPAKIALVTGSSGFIGRHIVRALIERGYIVRTLKRSASSPSGAVLRARSSSVTKSSAQTGRWPWVVAQTSNEPEPGPVQVVCGDLTPDDVARAAEGASVVFHLAGLTRAATEAEFLWANAEGTRATALGAARASAKLVYVSSLAAAGPGTPERPRTESDPCEPITAYGLSKLEGEKRVLEVAKMLPLEFSIVRPAGVYGPGDKDFLFAFQAAKLGVFPILGDPNRAYTLIHVADLVDGIIAAAEHPNAIGHAYFMGHPEPVRWGAILETLAGIFDKPYRPLPLPNAALEVAARLGEAGQAFGRVGLINKSRQRDLTAPGWVCDSSAMTRDLGVTATTALEPGFQATALWYKNARWI